MKLPKPSGNVKDLDYSTTTMWEEKELHCNKKSFHKISGSTRRVYCYDCGVYWDRHKIETP